jgi:hypothetical protein
MSKHANHHQHPMHLMLQEESHSHLLRITQIAEEVLEMAEQTMALQGEEWGYHPQTL